jgi:hypothetical protein
VKGRGRQIWTGLSLFGEILGRRMREFGSDSFIEIVDLDVN